MNKNQPPTTTEEFSVEYLAHQRGSGMVVQVNKTEPKK